MIKLDTETVQRLRLRTPVTRTPPDMDWEARRHQNEVRYWAAHLEDMARLLPSLRRHRGNEGAARLADDVLEEIKATQGERRAQEAREWLLDRWRDRRETVRARP